MKAIVALAAVSLAMSAALTALTTLLAQYAIAGLFGTRLPFWPLYAGIFVVVCVVKSGRSAGAS